jgi:phosphoglycolate phosphatase
MARNAGMDSVAVSYGAQSIESLQQFEPRLSIDRFSELHAWLEKQA